jgi:rod shape-determining protein MreC
MPLGTVDRTPPPFFKQGRSALSKLLVLGVVSALLMVIDAKRQWTQSVRQSVATLVYPLQWASLQPVQLFRWVGQYAVGLHEARQDAEQARAELALLAQKAAMAEYLTHENQALRDLLGIQSRLTPKGQGARILYEAPDAFSHKVVIDLGQRDGIESGSAVLDGHGVLGQVTRTYLSTAEVTLLIDQRQAIPVVNTRTGRRSLAFGRPGSPEPLLELRFESVNTDAEPGDLLTTSGIDGVYPPGLPVATIRSVSATGGMGFAQVMAEPAARMQSAVHVLVLAPEASAAATGQDPRPIQRNSAP